MKNFTEWLLEKEIREKEGPNEFGCMMVFVDFPQMKELQSMIDPQDVYEPKTHGLEKEPHVTLLYGLHDGEVKADKLFDVCVVDSNIKVGKISAFKNEEYDVLKFDADADFLYKCNDELKKFPHTTSYPNYHPHMTIGYLKSGTADKYIKKMGDKSYTVEPTKLVYSNPQMKKTSLELKVEA